MSGLDFVFQFSSKGDGDVNEKVEELKKSIHSLQEELAKAVETKEKLGKSLGKKASKGAKNIQSETDRERKAFNEQKRNVEFLEKKRARGATLTKKQNDYIEKFYDKWFKLDKEKIKELKDSDTLNLQNVQKTIEGQEKIEKNADKNHKNEIKRAKERMRMSGLVSGALKLTAAALGITFGVQYLREQFGKELGSQMTGTFTNLPSNFLVGIGQASRQFGGTPEQTQKAVYRLQSMLTLQRTDKGTADFLQRSLAMTGLTGNVKGAITREEYWSKDARDLLSGISRAYQGLTTQDEQRRAKEYLAQILGDEALVNMLTSGKYESLVSEYSNKPEKENIQKGAEVEAELKAKIEDVTRNALDYFFEILGKGLKEGFWEAASQFSNDVQGKVDSFLFPIFDSMKEEFSSPVIHPLQIPYRFMKGGFNWLFNDDEVKAGGDMSNAVNGAGGKVEINNTYEDNSVTEVNSVEEANQSKEGRASAANVVFSTGKRMAMGSSLQSTGV